MSGQAVVSDEMFERLSELLGLLTEDLLAQQEAIVELKLGDLERLSRITEDRCSEAMGLVKQIRACNRNVSYNDSTVWGQVGNKEPALNAKVAENVDELARIASVHAALLRSCRESGRVLMNVFGISSCVFEPFESSCSSQLEA